MLKNNLWPCSCNRFILQLPSRGSGFSKPMGLHQHGDTTVGDLRLVLLSSQIGLSTGKRSLDLGGLLQAFVERGGADYA
jgi:hypothetical protein